MDYFISKNNFPSIKTFLFFLGAGVLLCGGVFYVYPWVIGHAADLAFGHFSIPLFLARHPVVYGLVEGVTRLVYVFLSIASLDVFLLVFLYRVLDELVTKQGVVGGLLAVAGRALKPLLLGQLLLGGVLCLFLGWIPSFSSLALLPVFFSTSLSVCFFTACWVVSTLVFGTAFAVTEEGKAALLQARKLLKTHWLFWSFFFLAVVSAGFLPAVVFLKMGVSGGIFLSVFYLIFGMFNQLLVWSVFLSWLFRNPEVLAVN